MYIIFHIHIVKYMFFNATRFLLSKVDLVCNATYPKKHAEYTGLETKHQMSMNTHIQKIHQNVNDIIS